MCGVLNSEVAGARFPRLFLHIAVVNQRKRGAEENEEGNGLATGGVRFVGSPVNTSLSGFLCPFFPSSCLGV